MLNCICSNCNTRIDVGEDTHCSGCFEDLQAKIIDLEDKVSNLENQIEELEKKE
jgi:uncharacterized protein (DUF342 family)